MSQNQPWNVGGFHPQGLGGVQMYDPTQYQTSANATLTNHTPTEQKVYNPGQFQQQQEVVANAAHNTEGMNNVGPESNIYQNQGQGQTNWTNGNPNEWQPQNFFSPSDSQQWQNWNHQQASNQWEATSQQQQQQQQPDATSQQQQWTQPSDPVWSEPEPWLNENSSWGGQGMDTQQGGQFMDYRAGGFNQEQTGVTSESQPFQTPSVSQSNTHTPFSYASPDSSWGSAGNQTSEQQQLFTPSVSTVQSPAQVPLISESLAGNTQQIQDALNLHDSGTVSSFFGSNDVYEPVVSPPKGEDKVPAAAPSAIPASLQVPAFNRTASEISNSSLVTCNNSSLESLDGDAPLTQDVSNLSDQLQATSIQDCQKMSPYIGEAPTEQQIHPVGAGLSSGVSGGPNSNQSQVHVHPTTDNYSPPSQQMSEGLGNILNHSGTGRLSHHSSLDSGDLGLGSGMSSGPGTPGKPVAADLSTVLQQETSIGSQQHMYSNSGGFDIPGVASSSAKRNLNESLLGSNQQPDHNPGHQRGPNPSSQVDPQKFNQDEMSQSASGTSSSTVSQSYSYNQEIASLHDSHSALDTSGSSSLNASSDTIVPRSSSAFKPLSKSPSTSRTNSLSREGSLDGSASKKPPRPPSEGREFSYIPHRPHSRQKHRSDNNVSPATTLWAQPESFNASVILAPAAPSPLMSPLHKPKTAFQVLQQPSVEKVVEPVKNFPKSEETQKVSQEIQKASKETQKISKESEGKRERDIKETPRRGEAPRDPRPPPQYHDEKPRRKGRHRRQVSKEVVLAPDTKVERDIDDRPGSRNDSLTGEYNDAYESTYSDSYYRDYYRNRGYAEEYDRPRSRQEDYREQRPRSRADNDRPRSRTEVDRPRSRTDYDRPSSRSAYERPNSRAENRPSSRTDYDRYYDRDYRSKYKGYDYNDPYYKQSYYYDREYYDYHHNRYAMGYYDEYYRQAYDNRYQGYNQESVASYNEDADRTTQYSGTSRGNTPSGELNQSITERDGYASRPSSRQQRYGHYDDPAYASTAYDNMAYAYNYHGYGYDPYSEYAPKSEAVAKYSLPHIGIGFSAGGHLILIQPNRPKEGQPAVVQVHELDTLLQDDEEVEEIEEFPGPLIKGETHKNDVLSLCQKRALQCRDDIDMMDRDSAELLWRFLELLIKQNGTIVGTDISDLLLEGHEPTTLEYKSSGMKISTSQSQSLENLAEIGEDEAEKPLTVVADRSLINRRNSLTVEDVTDRFRHLLLYGRKKDSLDWAMKHNLWGHALFLASKMDTRTHANVMIRFANSSMRMNDPLQTLYQLMSGRQPAAVTCISDERWGDWRPHLAMILSNNTQKPDLDRKSIVTLGDTLASRGYLYASHFCYLMAQVGFGTYSKPTSKIVLVGSSHSLPFDEFSTNEAIQCTEVYEYALSLGNPLSSLSTFQPYKFMYACRMAEFGLTPKALHYCEVIGSTVNQSPGLYPPTFVKQLTEMSNRLKFSDPQRQEVGFSVEDPYWLQQLQRSCQGLEDGSIQPISGAATPLEYGTTTGSSESGEIAGLTSGAEMTYEQYPNGTEGEEGAYQQGYTAEQWQQQQQQYADGSGVAGQAEAIPYQQYTGEEQQQQPTDPNFSNQTYDLNQYNQGYDYNYQQNADGSYSYGGQTAYDNTEKRLSQDSTGVADTGFSGDPLSFGERRYSVSGGTISKVREETSDVTDGTHPPNQTTDYWGASTTTQKVYGRPRTTSGGSSISSGRQRTISGGSTNSVKASPYTNRPSQSIQPMNRTADKKKQTSNQAGGGSSFLGFLRSKLPFTASKNEMKLPKDEKPTIIWDPVKNRWVNTDGEEEEEAPAGPPPTDMELTGPSPMAPNPMAAAGPMTGNRFQRPKTRGARNRYVDVLNPGSTTTTTTSSSANVPTSLFNIMPSTNSTPQNIFIPGAVPGSSHMNPVGGVTHASPQTTPADTAPISSASLPGENKHSRSSSLSSLSREVQQFTQQAIAQAEQESLQDPLPANPSMPMMFNPSQFNQGQQNTNQSANPAGPRYGQRRQYPKRS